MPADITLEAIVIRRQESGENDRRLVLLAAEEGKVAAIAKGARKSGSRLAGSSEPLVRALFTLAKGPRQMFVTQVQPITSYPGIRSDYDRLATGMAVCELLDGVMAYDSPSPEIWEAMLGFCTGLNEQKSPAAVCAWMLVRLMLGEGHLPSWLECIESGSAPLESPCWVSPIAGGRILAEHRHLYADAMPVSPEAIIGLEKLAALDAPPSRLRHALEVLQVLAAFWESILERPLKGLRSVLSELRSAPGSLGPENVEFPG